MAVGVAVPVDVRVVVGGIGVDVRVIVAVGGSPAVGVDSIAPAGPQDAKRMKERQAAARSGNILMTGFD